MDFSIPTFPPFQPPAGPPPPPSPWESPCCCLSPTPLSYPTGGKTAQIGLSFKGNECVLNAGGIAKPLQAALQTIAEHHFIVSGSKQRIAAMDQNGRPCCVQAPGSEAYRGGWRGSQRPPSPLASNHTGDMSKTRAHASKAAILKRLPRKTSRWDTGWIGFLPTCV